MAQGLNTPSSVYQNPEVTQCVDQAHQAYEHSQSEARSNIRQTAAGVVTSWVGFAMFVTPYPPTEAVGAVLMGAGTASVLRDGTQALYHENNARNAASAERACLEP
jgi:hypothetical protein